MPLSPFDIFSSPELRERVRAYLLERLPRGPYLCTNPMLLQFTQVPPAALKFAGPPVHLGNYVGNVAQAHFVAPLGQAESEAMGVRMQYEDRELGELVDCGWRPFRTIQRFAPQRRSLEVQLHLFTKRPRQQACMCLDVTLLQ